MRARLLVFAVVIGLSASASLAAPNSTAPTHVKVDPAALQAADRLLTAMGYERMMKQSCDAMVAQMGPMFKKVLEDKTGEPADDALVSQLTGIESDVIDKILDNSPDIRKAIETLYASEFTAAELNHLADFFQDPVMRKWTQVAPDMSAKMLPLVEGVADSHRSELEDRIKNAVIDYYAAKKHASDS
jgi:hypothetical protein